MEVGQEVQASNCSLRAGLASDGEEELELGRELVFGVESVGEIDSTNTAVGVDLDSENINRLVS